MDAVVSGSISYYKENEEDGTVKFRIGPYQAVFEVKLEELGGFESGDMIKFEIAPEDENRLNKCCLVRSARNITSLVRTW